MALVPAGTNLDLAARANVSLIVPVLASTLIPISGFHIDPHQNLGCSDGIQTRWSEFNSWSCQDKLRDAFGVFNHAISQRQKLGLVQVEPGSVRTISLNRAHSVAVQISVCAWPNVRMSVETPSRCLDIVRIKTSR
jgi:hypothetical protein